MKTRNKLQEIKGIMRYKQGKECNWRAVAYELPANFSI